MHRVCVCVCAFGAARQRATLRSNIYGVAVNIWKYSGFVCAWIQLPNFNWKEGRAWNRNHQLWNDRLFFYFRCAIEITGQMWIHSILFAVACCAKLPLSRISCADEIFWRMEMKQMMADVWRPWFLSATKKIMNVEFCRHNWSITSVKLCNRRNLVRLLSPAAVCSMFMCIRIASASFRLSFSVFRNHRRKKKKWNADPDINRIALLLGGAAHV